MLRQLARTIDSSRSLILFATFAGFFFVRTTFLPLMHDDYAYAFIWDGAHGGNLEGMQFGSAELEQRVRISSLNDIVASLESYYFTWSGRIFACGLVQVFLWLGKPVFDIANTIAFLFLVLTIINLANTWLKISRAAVLWIFFALFILMPAPVSNMFWLTGACNYLWMAFFQLFFLTPYVKALRSHEAANSLLNVVLMILLGLLAGCSNEAGSFATVCLTLFLIIMCKARNIFRSWMPAGFAALIVGCVLMTFAPGNLIRLAHVVNQSESFLSVVTTDLIALIPMFIYFVRRKSSAMTMAELLMLAFTAAGLIVAIASLLSPTRIALTSLAFILVASSSAILELERQHIKALNLPINFLRGVSLILIVSCVSYFATLLYVDLSIFNANRRQVRYIQRNAELDPIPMPPMPIRNRFKDIHGDKSAVDDLKHFAGIGGDLNAYQNALVAQYYGVRHVIAVDD